MNTLTKLDVLERENLSLKEENIILKGNIDYNIMMGNLDDPSGEEQDDE